MIIGTGILGLALTSPASSQTMEQAVAQGTDASGSHLFLLNPAAFAPSGVRAEGLLVRQFKDSQFDFRRDDNEVRKSAVKEETFGVSVLGDLGAGAGAGLTVGRMWEETSSTSTNTNNKPKELMKKQSVAGRLVVDLTPEVRTGLTIRHLAEEANIVGGMNTPQSSSIVYKGTLVGYTAGVSARLTSDLQVGGLYMPAMRGKADILGEEKIITEPGMAALDFSYGHDAARIGMAYQRWVHKRDDRADNTTSGGENNRTIILNGMDFDENLFPATALTLGADYRFQPSIMGRLSVTQEEDEFIFNADETPNGQKTHQAVKFYRARAAVRLINTRVQLQAGGGLFQRSLSLTQGRGAPAGEYKASGRELFLMIGTAI